jgi:hypothetical protein
VSASIVADKGTSFKKALTNMIASSSSESCFTGSGLGSSFGAGLGFSTFGSTKDSRAHK